MTTHMSETCVDKHTNKFAPSLSGKNTGTTNFFDFAFSFLAEKFGLHNHRLLR